MKHTNNELEPPRKVGRGKPAVENCENPNSHSGINDDDSSLNLTRREGSDDSRRVQAMLKTKKSTKIATFNARTLREDWRLEELVSCMSINDIEIIGVQEHRRVSEEETTFAKKNNYHLITASAWRNKAQAATGGVGIVLSRKAENALSKVEVISPRVMTATFAGNPETTIIVAYSPTNLTTNDEEVEEFYEHLRKAIDSTPTHNFLAILGDMNAKISATHVKFAYTQKTNRNGKLLLELCHEKSLCIVNTKFQKRMGKRWTYEDPKGGHHLMDYILVNSKWINSVKNAESYSSFASVGSDHRVVTMDVKLSLRVTRAPTKNPAMTGGC